ncbi:Gfo/Idh/MocA family protein [Pelosinus sp. sgz500959]|uniref:Gfo/Idh/MocA family protein n=1 Tax=Pelosinus sp. sgz500959 TaxID=3242472 RepID=UPI003672918B
MKNINWGILSTGTIAKKFATTIAQLADCGNIIAIASRNEESAKQFATDYHISKAYSTYKELAQDPEIDVVYIGTPHSSHYENAKLCLENGKNVLCEKSFTTNAAQAKELIQLAREKNLFIMEAFWTKFLPAYQELHEIIKSGIIGKITHFRAQYGFAPPGARYIRKMDPQLAGGALLDIGVYTIGVAAMILGYDPKNVYSSGIIGEYGTDQFNNIMLEYEDGVTANLIATIGSIINQEAIIFGTKGHLILPEFSALQSFKVVLDDGTQYVKEFPFIVNGFEYQIRETEKCLRAQVTESNIMTHENTIAIMTLMDKVRSDLGLIFPWE